MPMIIITVLLSYEVHTSIIIVYNNIMYKVVGNYIIYRVSLFLRIGTRIFLHTVYTLEIKKKYMIIINKRTENIIVYSNKI